MAAGPDHNPVSHTEWELPHFLRKQESIGRALELGFVQPGALHTLQRIDLLLNQWRHHQAEACWKMFQLCAGRTGVTKADEQIHDVRLSGDLVFEAWTETK